MMRYNNLFSAQFILAVYHDLTVKELCLNYHDYLCSKHEGRLPSEFTDQQVYALLKHHFTNFSFQNLHGQITCQCERFGKHDTLDFFDILLAYSDDMIVRCDNRYRFKYIYTDIWRNMTKKISEEIFVISAVIQEDIRRNITERKSCHMDWSYCIEHDDYELHRLLRRGQGVSDNHFHLRGSSPYFDVSWIYLMNNISDADYENKIDEIESNLLKEYPNRKADYSLKIIWRKAAAIRMYLYLEVTGSPKAEAYFDDIIRFIIPYERTSICTFPLNEIQKLCNLEKKYNTADYAHTSTINSNQKYKNLLGERYILYKSMMAALNGNDNVKQLLFLYLLMKNRFYSEYVQSNERVGFHNFCEYQDRKDGIIPYEEEREIAADTICSVIEGNKLHRMELRISPEYTKAEMHETIQLYEGAIEDALERMPSEYNLSREKNFFYTLHFIKKEDTLEKVECRHFALRKELEQKAEVIRDLHLDSAKRVYGIDAAGLEMNCRPEVFAPTFRYILRYLPERDFLNGSILQQLKATYHVGEDNYDITDSLRAVYEAITFLELYSGCRLGHATYLGIPVEEFYSNNGKHVTMPCQVFLDNIVWMYYYLLENNIEFEGISRLISYLKDKFDEYFSKIFLKEVHCANIECRLETAINHGCIKLKKNQLFPPESCQFDMQHYYWSYLLRGDDPYLYRKGYCNFNECRDTQSYKIGRSKSQMSEARTSFEAGFLYYLYHYNYNVKEIGLTSTEEVLPDIFIKGLKYVQKDLKRTISRLGIGIETNPTSNLFISTITNYAEHPISDFYDNALNHNPNEVQLNVSINTDDKSVFSTCLSNEYAYIMFYLETKKDKNNNYMYSRIDILRWLDDIRKMGNEQAFLN